MKFFLSIAFALICSPSFAQSLDCTPPYPTTQTRPNGVGPLSWCWDGKDSVGVPAVAIGWNLIIDGVRQPALINITNETPNVTTGFSKYKTTFNYQKAPQAKNFVIELVTEDGVILADPLSVTVKGAGPSKPVGTKVIP